MDVIRLMRGSPHEDTSLRSYAKFTTNLLPLIIITSVIFIIGQAILTLTKALYRLITHY
jgi:large-conductance mechanosensitive channel